MTTYTDDAGNTLDLPKLTLKLSEEMDAVPNQATHREIAKAMYTFVCKVLPADYLKERLDGSSLDDIDIVELRRVYEGIDGAYTDAMDTGRMQEITDRVESMKPMLEAMEKVVSMSNQTQRQGFKRVK